MSDHNVCSILSSGSGNSSGGVPIPLHSVAGSQFSLSAVPEPPISIQDRRFWIEAKPESYQQKKSPLNQENVSAGGTLATSLDDLGLSFLDIQFFSKPSVKDKAQFKRNFLPQHGINIKGRLPIEAPQFRSQLNMEQEATQPATQPYYDPRRAGQSGSLNPEDDADILLFLHPNTTAACQAVQRCAEYSPQHIRHNAGLPDIDDGGEMPDSEHPTGNHGNGGLHESSPLEHDLALRLSSKVTDICLGFVFGRDPNLCDIIIKPEDRPVLRISSMHFRIYVTGDGIVMLEDMSTNGTFVDETLLKCKNPDIGVPQRRTLDHGSIISVITWTDKETKKSERAKFIVRIPERSPEGLMLYRANLQRYINAKNEARENAEQTVANIARNTRKPPNATPEQIVGLGDGLFGVGSARFNHGMRWNGGNEYCVVDQIGKGAFATVYKLATRSEGTLFAAKEIEKLRFARNGQIDTKLNHELEIMKKLDHPHIVKFEDFYDYTTHLYIILEFVGCGDLLGYMHRNGRMEEVVTQSMTRQLCHALSYIHSRNITHRDVKPDNILLASLNPLVIKLSDFGLSKMIENEGASVLKTFCGTLLYCAPEVYPDYERMRARHSIPLYGKEIRTDSPRYGSNVDIWSLAAVVFHVLVMEPPFEGKAENHGAGMLQTIMRTHIDFSPFFAAGISDECIDLLESMLRINPEDRPDANDCLRHAWICDVPDVGQHVRGAIQDIDHDTSRPIGGDEPRTERNSAYSNRLDRKVIGQKREASLSPSPGFELSTIETRGGAPNGGQARARLFGEVTSSGLADSGIFGANQAPLIAIKEVVNVANTNAQQGSRVNKFFLRNEDNEMPEEDLVSGLSSTVSQIQELTVESPVLPPGWPGSPFASTTTSGVKRARESENGEAEIHSRMGASKKVMTSNIANAISNSATYLSPLGMLSPVQGSIDDNVLLLTDRISIWGRYQENSHVFPNPLDVRIPKIGMDLVFWCPGMEEAIKRGTDWLSLGGTHCLLKTRSSKGIKINGITMDKDASGGPFRCGKLMTGDVVEIFDHGEVFLKYECEFFHGESRHKRAIGDGFRVEVNHELWNSANARVAELSTRK